MIPKTLILHATGTNRDHDAAAAIGLAGGDAEIVHLNQLRRGEKKWSDYQMLVLSGGFSYADALGAGKLLALDMNTYFDEEIHSFITSGKPVIGICNGFQALIKSGLLIQMDKKTEVKATLTFNASGHFECRWVTLKPISKKCIWTQNLSELIDCPVAHGEGNFMLDDITQVNTLIESDQIAFTYVNDDGKHANGRYPANPNGSIMDIAGICNRDGNVLGLMPHPENHIHHYQHPLRSRGMTSRIGLSIFINGIKYSKQI